MILRVTQYGEPILRQVGKTIEVFDESLAELANDMVDTMYDEEGIGLAAQQVDRALQICVIDVRPPEGVEVPFHYRFDGKQPPLDLIMPLALINPQVTITDPTEDDYNEGCLSFPGVTGKVDRPVGVRCQFQDTEGQPHTLEADGLLGRCILHEVDHLNGKLFIDRIDKPDHKKNEAKIKNLKRQSRDYLKSR
ncbi:MAG: peptide deformylase, partial [Puniceicoccaceae bacterium]